MTDEEFWSYVATIIIAWFMVALINNGDWPYAVALYFSILMCLIYGECENSSEDTKQRDLLPPDAEETKRTKEKRTKADNIIEWTLLLIAIGMFIEMLCFFCKLAAGLSVTVLIFLL